MLHQKISILGCGWLGKPLAVRLIALGYTVNGSTRSVQKASQLKVLGIHPFIIDIENLSDSLLAFLECEILIISITSKNLDHYRLLLARIEKSSVKNVLFISSTSVYKAENTIVTEETITDFESSPIVTIETLFKNCNTIKVTVVRFAGLFGYDRKPGNFLAGKKAISDPKAYVNLIHQDDCIQILEAIVTRQIWGETFNGCADNHPTREEFYIKAALDIGVTPPEFENEGDSVYKIISNTKVKQILGIRFKYNDLMNLRDK